MYTYCDQICDKKKKGFSFVRKEPGTKEVFIAGKKCINVKHVYASTLSCRRHKLRLKYKQRKPRINFNGKFVRLSKSSVCVRNNCSP